MQTQWSAFLAAEKAAGRGGIVWPEPIVRGLAFAIVLQIPADVSGDQFKAALRLSPDAAGAVLAEMTVTVGSFADGVTPVTLALSAAQTAPGGALPADADFDGLAEVLADVLYKPAGGAWMRSMAVSIPISGRITEPAA